MSMVFPGRVAQELQDGILRLGPPLRPTSHVLAPPGARIEEVIEAVLHVHVGTAQPPPGHVPAAGNPQTLGAYVQPANVVPP